MQIDIMEGIAEQDKEDLRGISMLVVKPRYRKHHHRKWRTSQEKDKCRENKQRGMLTETKHTAATSKGLAKATEVVCLVIEPATMLCIILAVGNVSGLSVPTYVIWPNNEPERLYSQR